MAGNARSRSRRSNAKTPGASGAGAGSARSGSARSGSARGDDAEGTRRRILDATMSLLAEGSYAGTSISAICKRSGMPPTSIYWHFKSKEGLLAAVTEEGAERWFQSTFEWDEPGDDLREGLSVRLEQLVDLLVENPPFLRLLVMFAIERKHVDKACLETVRRVRKRAIDRLVLWFAPAFPAKTRRAAEASARELAKFSLAVFDGTMLAYQIDPEETDLRRLLDQLGEVLLTLAAARGADIGPPPRSKSAASAAARSSRARGGAGAGKRR